MKILSYLSFFTFIVYFAFFVYFIWLNNRSRLYLIFSLLCLLFSVWSLAYTFGFDSLPHETEKIWFWDKVGSIAWTFFPAVALSFFSILTNRRSLFVRRFVIPLFYFVGVFLLYKSWKNDLLVAEWVYINGFWYYNANYTSVGYWLFNALVFVSFFLCISYLYKWYKYAKTNRERKQAWLVFNTFIIFSALSVITNVILPAFRLRLLPNIANIFSIIWIFGIGYAIIKYKLLLLNPKIAANAVISKMHDLLFFLDLEGNIINTNDFTLQTLGLSKKELINKNFITMFLGKKKVKNNFDNLLRGEESANFNSHLISKSREAIPVNISLTMVKDEHDDIMGIVMVGHDISQTRQLQKEINERKRIEKELLAQRDMLNKANLELEQKNKELEKLSLVVRETDNSVIIVDKDGSLEWVNDGFVRLYGYTLDEFIQVKGKDIFTASEHKQIEELFKRCVNNRETVIYDIKNKTKSVEYKWVQTSLTPIVKNGSIEKVIAVETDITRIKQAEEEIRKKNEEIINQRDELEATHKILKQTFDAIKAKNKDITDSIIYAQKIQQAILPKQQFINEVLPNSFIYYRPKDIVSGDFYWVDTNEDWVYFAVVDCTGHGVPGAFMSIVGHNLLTQAINDERINKPSEILNFLSEGVHNTLRLKSDDALVKDGMDLALCAINFKLNKLQYAGAYNPMIIVRENQIIEFKADNYPIGDPCTSEFTTYTNNEFSLQKGDTIYIFSDGYIDQFGGGNQRKKFSTKRFKKTLLEINHIPIAEQKDALANIINTWMGSNDQYDDILIMGVKV